MLWKECERDFSSWHCAVWNIPFLLASEHPSCVWGGVQSRASWEAHHPAALHLSDAIKQQGKRTEELVNLSHPACSKDYWCCIIHQSMTDLVAGSAARGVQLLPLLQLPIKLLVCENNLWLCVCPWAFQLVHVQRSLLPWTQIKCEGPVHWEMLQFCHFLVFCNVIEVGKYGYFLCNNNPEKF